MNIDVTQRWFRYSHNLRRYSQITKTAFCQKIISKISLINIKTAFCQKLFQKLA